MSSMESPNPHTTPKSSHTICFRRCALNSGASRDDGSSRMGNCDSMNAAATNMTPHTTICPYRCCRYSRMDEIDRRISEIPQIEVYSKTTGRGMRSGQGSSSGMFSIRLKHWDERTGEGDDLNSVIQEIYKRTDDIKSAKIQVFTRGMIPGYGASDGFELYVQDQAGGSVENLLQVTRQFIERLNERKEISRANTSFDINYPQYLLEVDAVRCKRNGVSPADVLDVLSGYIGGNYSSNMNRFSKLYRVMVQASPEFRLDTQALSNIFVRNDKGEMSPIGQYIKLTRVYGAQSLTRFNLFSAIQINGNAANGYSTGEAIEAIREVAAEVLPIGIPTSSAVCREKKPR